MRPLTLCIVLVVLTAGCARPVEDRAPAAASLQATPAPVVPDRIARVAMHLPDGYERGRADQHSSAVGYWGFRDGWSADPPQCAALVGSTETGEAKGISGSGPGGTLYVVVTPAPVDPGLVGRCGHWTIAGGQSRAEVDSAVGPDIAGAQTATVTASIRTLVESGSATDTAARTYLARVDGASVFVALITDPGSPEPPLDPSYAAQLLTTTVAVLRGG